MLLCVKLTGCMNALVRVLTNTSSIFISAIFGWVCVSTITIFVALPRFCPNFYVWVYVSTIDTIKSVVVESTIADPLTMLCVVRLTQEIALCVKLREVD